MISLVGISGCAEGTTGDLKVSAGEHKIKSIRLNNPKNESFSTSESSPNSEKSEFGFAFKQEASMDIQYLKVGDVVTLNFGHNKPDTISLKDSVLNQNGDVKYSYRETLEVPLRKEHGKYKFTINKHIASYLDSSHIENKKVYRGFSLTATWGEEEYRYAFVVKTDGPF